MSRPGTVAPLEHGLQNPAWYIQVITQFWALTWYKAVRVAARNLRATILRLLVAPLLFMLLTFVVTKGLDHAPQNRAYNRIVRRRDFESVQAIPDCTTDWYYTRDFTCWDLFYSPTTDNDINAVVDAIRLNNPGRPIPSNRVLGFPSREASNQFLSQNLLRRVNGALHFNKAGNAISFTLQTNSSVRTFKGLFQDRTFWSEVPIQVAAEREIVRYNFQQAGRTFDAANWKVETSGYPHPSLADSSIVGQIIGPFLFASNMFGFVLLIAAVVSERELKLRQALRTMGMLDSSYWLSWVAFEVVMAAITALLICAFGSAFQFQLFFDNGWELPFLLFFLFQLAMSSEAILFSTFCKSSSTAVTLGFVIFIVGWIMQLIVVFGFPYSPDYVNKDRWATIVFALFPWSLLVKATSDLGRAVIPGNPGIHWQSRSSYCQNLSQQQIAMQPATSQYRDFQCVLSLNGIYWILLAEWVAYLLLAIYMDNILPNENGTRRPFYYIFTPNFWAPSRRRNYRHRPGMVATSAGPQFLHKPVQHSQIDTDLDDDVATEQARTQELLEHRTSIAGDLASQGEGIPTNAIELFGLQKVFRGTTRLRKWLCCGRGSKPDFWAIKGSWFTIPESQLFCLLGPNGAGKTTTINCLTGILPPTAGDALVHGEAISSPGGIDRARRWMGVCPQFDILWDQLTGREHLLIYGNIKGLARRVVAQQADELLAKVQLTEAAHQRSGSYSGGMKRRLSVAIALLGDPKIVFLDEPTTGMDPISRRHVWDIIEEAKKGRAVILTTHSMEEADVLGDRIAIMARGNVRCIGSSLRLKQRFGAGYQLSLSHATVKGTTDKVEVEKRQAKTKDFVQAELGLEPSDETGAYTQFLIPRSADAVLPDFLFRLEAQRQALGITDVNIRLTSLEEVFLTIARQAERQAAEASGDVKRKFPLPDGTNLEVELGAETAVHGRTEEVYNIKWAQDDSGALQILDAIPTGNKRDGSSDASSSV